MREEKQGEKEELFPRARWEESRKQEVEVKMSNLPGLAAQGQSARWWLLVFVPQGITETTFASGPQHGGDTAATSLPVLWHPGSACAGVFRENLSSTFPAQELLATFDDIFLWHRGKTPGDG